MKKILLLVCFVVFMASCSDDKTTNPDDDNPGGSGNYFMTTKGAYWIYQNDTENEDGTTVSTKDSVTLKNIEEKDGKEAYKCKTYTDTNNDGKYENDGGTERSFATSSGKLYIHKDAFLPENIGSNGIFDVSSQIQFKDDWIKIADNSDDEWDIVESDINTEIPGVGATLTGTLDIEGENLKQTKDIVVNGKTITTDGYEVEFSFDGKVTTEQLPVAVPFTFTMTTTYWIAKGIGPVKTETTGMKVESVLAGSIPEQPGSTSTLIKYSVGK